MQVKIEEIARKDTPTFRDPNSGYMQTAIRLDDDTHKLVSLLAQYNEISFAAQVRRLINRGLGIA